MQALQKSKVSQLRLKQSKNEAPEISHSTARTRT